MCAKVHFSLYQAWVQRKWQHYEVTITECCKLLLLQRAEVLLSCSQKRFTTSAYPAFKML